jgi:hypothetical protein
MIENGTGPAFREFVVIYHEIGDEAFRPVNKHGDFLPQRDPLTDAYRPGARALNYRSEPFGINNIIAVTRLPMLPRRFRGAISVILQNGVLCMADPKCSIPTIRMADRFVGNGALGRRKCRFGISAKMDPKNIR